LAETVAPGAAPEWRFRLWCRVLRQPRLLRALAAIVRRWPRLTRWSSLVARRDMVVDVFVRSASFSHTAHAPNLVAGEFAIGLPDGPRHRQERAEIEAMLRSASHLGGACAVIGRQRIAALVGRHPARDDGCFDLVDDYLGPVAWRAMQRCFGSAGESMVRNGPGAASAEAAEPQFLRELRHVGSHLVVGGLATPQVQARAEASAAALNDRVKRREAALHTALASRLPAAPSGRLHRNAVGLMWVAHPATVQAGVHLMLELLARPTVHADLRATAHAAGATAWLDPALRARLADHVLELLRFRPPFPILTRDVPRDTWLAPGDEEPLAIGAGQTVKLMVIGALFDPRATTDPSSFRPDRLWQDPRDRFLVFGFGHRRCPASQHVLEMLVSMLIGLLLLPGPCRLAHGRRALEYDGPAAVHMRLAWAGA
jgi:cytochrome P450